MGKEAVAARNIEQLESRAFGEQLEAASERQGGVWGWLWVMVFLDIEEAGGKPRLEAETMSSF